MAAIRKSVTIPPDHRLHVDLEIPPEVPPGEAELVVYLESPRRAKADGQKAVALLRRIAARGTLRAAIPDPQTWQRDVRQDRVLPDRV